MTDFHSHVLPGMDDGSKNIEESLSMLRMLGEQGVRRVVATPHFYATREDPQRFLARRERCYAELAPHLTDEFPRVVLGAEVKFYQGVSNMDDLRALCITGTDILLLEMPFNRWSKSTVKEVFDIVNIRNLRVALAHVDRYFSFAGKRVWQELEMSDVLMQANAESFSGHFTSRRLLAMIGRSAIDMIGSDSHNLTNRAPNINIAYDAIRKRYGDDLIRDFVRYQEHLLD